MRYASAIAWGSVRATNNGDANSQKGTSPFPSSQDKEDGDVVWDPIEEITSGEEALPLMFLQNAF